MNVSVRALSGGSIMPECHLSTFLKGGSVCPESKFFMPSERDLD